MLSLTFGHSTQAASYKLQLQSQTACRQHAGACDVYMVAPNHVNELLMVLSELQHVFCMSCSPVVGTLLACLLEHLPSCR